MGSLNKFMKRTGCPRKVNAHNNSETQEDGKEGEFQQLSLLTTPNP